MMTTSQSRMSTQSSLTVFQATTADSGTYTCRASNQYEEEVAESVVVRVFSGREDCWGDNPYFNCNLVINYNLCGESTYYSKKMCCWTCSAH